MLGIMKKILLFLGFSAFISISFSQSPVTITEANQVPSVGDTIIYERANHFGFDPEGEGPVNDKLWDYPDLPATGVERTYSYHDVDATSHGYLFPHATIAESDSDAEGGYVYYEVNDNDWLRWGFAAPDPQLPGGYFWGVYNAGALEFPFPITAGDFFTSSYEGDVSPLGAGEDSVKIEDGNISISADAQGTLVLPTGTFTNVLRIKIIESFKLVVYMYGMPVTTQTVEFESYYWFHEDHFGPVLMYYKAWIEGNPEEEALMFRPGIEGAEYYTLTLEAYPEDGGSVAGGGEYEMGEEVEIIAEANEGWEFSEWTGDIEHVDNPSSATATVTMPAEDIGLTANFIMTGYLLTLKVEPEEGGSATGAGEYNTGEEVEIVAEASEGWEFAEWTGDIEHVDNPSSATATVTMPAQNIELTANFEMGYYQLTLEIAPEEDCGNVTGAGEYKMGEEVEVVAEANEGWFFGYWWGDTDYVDDPYNATTTVTMPAKDIKLTAFFSHISVKEITAVEVKVFPNPARDMFTVESSEMINHVRLIDISGQVVKEIAADALSTNINVNTLNTGVYFLQIHTGKNVITKRVQIAR